MFRIYEEFTGTGRRQENVKARGEGSRRNNIKDQGLTPVIPRVYAHGKEDVIVDDNPVYLHLSEDEGERKRKYREFVRGMLKEKEAMKKEMDKRAVYGNAGFAGEMTDKYKIQEMIRPKGRQIGWRKK